MPPDPTTNNIIRPPNTSNVRVVPRWCCPCGTPIKPFDFRIDGDEIVLDCRHCHVRLLEIETAPTATKEPL
jgi:hypothetical protein